MMIAMRVYAEFERCTAGMAYCTILTSVYISGATFINRWFYMVAMMSHDFMLYILHSRKGRVVERHLHCIAIGKNG